MRTITISALAAALTLFPAAAIAQAAAWRYQPSRSRRALSGSGARPATAAAIGEPEKRWANRASAQAIRRGPKAIETPR